MSRLKVDTIEDRSGSGITLDDTLKVDTISEKTSANGVTIDGVLLKDNLVASSAGGSLVLLHTLTASDSPTLISDNFVDDTKYNSYRIVCENILPSSNNPNMLVVFRQGGGSGSDITGTYKGAKYRIGLNTTSNNTNYSNQSGTNYIEWAYGLRNPSTTSKFNGVFDFFPNSSDGGSTHFNGAFIVVSATNNGDIYYWNSSGILYSSTNCTGLKWYMGNGNVESGQIYIYGVKK